MATPAFSAEGQPKDTQPVLFETDDANGAHVSPNESKPMPDELMLRPDLRVVRLGNTCAVAAQELEAQPASPGDLKIWVGMVKDRIHETNEKLERGQAARNHRQAAG